MHQESNLLAQINPTTLPTLFPAARYSDPAALINIIAPVLTTGAALLFGVMLFRAAFLVLTAGSDKEQITKAASTATWAVVGIVVVVAAYLIVKLLEFILGIDLPL